MVSVGEPPLPAAGEVEKLSGGGGEPLLWWDGWSGVGGVVGGSRSIWRVQTESRRLTATTATAAKHQQCTEGGQIEVVSVTVSLNQLCIIQCQCQCQSLTVLISISCQCQSEERRGRKVRYETKDSQTC